MMEPESDPNPKPPEGKKSRRKPRKRDIAKLERIRREGKPEGKKPNHEDSGTIDSSCAPDAESFLSTWREYFSNHKALLLVMDYHSLRITKRRSESVFKCLICDHCLTSLEEVNAHIQRPRHLSRLRANWLYYTIDKLYPTPQVIEILDKFLENEARTSACTGEILLSRRETFELITSRVKEAWPDAVVHMVGSSYHGLGLIDCDLNISVSCDKDCPVAVPIAKLSSYMESLKGEFQAFERHFNEEKKPPYMSFNWKGQLPCNFLILDNHSHKLAKLIKEYGKIDDRCRKLSVLFRKWAFFCSVDGDSEGCWPSHAIYLMVIYFLQQLPEPVLPVLHSLIPTANGLDEVYENISDLVHTQWKTKNNSNLATLWIQLLKFYCLDFDPINNIVCITQLALKKRSGSYWSGKRIAIMDPFDSEKNVTRTVSNSTVYDFIMHCLRTTCTYFCIPQFEEGPLFGTIRPPPANDKLLNTPGYSEFLEVQMRLSHYIVRLLPHIDSNYLSSNPTDKVTTLEKINAMKGIYINMCSMNMDHFNKLNSRCKPKKNEYVGYNLFFEDAQFLMSRIDLEKLHYQFSYPVFSAGEEHPRCCLICAKNGHTQNSCPEMMLEKIVDLPQIDEELIKLIDCVCYDLFYASKPSESDVAKKDQTLDYLQQYVQALFPDACLTLFGSSKNGFGLKNSDMDICLTFKDCPHSAGVPAGALGHLFKYMKKSRDLRKLIHIQNAKVPIIKFLHLPSMLEGDISLYNILAQENTKLLWTYSEIDVRVKILGYMVKRFAKVCNVGDASKGSLSSYCYVLMMIYFLQKCNPPVIPVLQNLPHTAGQLPKKYVDACNTYFFEDTDKLSEVWPGYKNNQKSPGQLWIEFLRFYTEEFDVENYVVSIRSDEPVLKLENVGSRRCLPLRTHLITTTIWAQD